MDLRVREDRREVWIEGHRIQKRVSSKKVYDYTGAPRDCKEISVEFLTHLTPEIENKRLTVMFSNMVRLLLITPLALSLRWKTTARVAIVCCQEFHFHNRLNLLLIYF